MTPVRVVVADDQDVVRAGFGALLATQPDFTVVGSAPDGAAAVRLAREVHPDVILMDVRMPVLDGIEACRQIVGPSRQPVSIAGPPGPRSGTSAEASGGSQRDLPRVIMLTTFDLDEYVYDALTAGASGFLLKDMAAEQLFDAVRVVAAGEALLAPTVTRRLIGEFVRLRPSAATPSPVSQLTPRETEVLLLIAEGLSNPEIAARLVLSNETVKTHVGRVLSKLGVRDRVQAVIAAYESALVVPRSQPSDSR